LRAQPPGLVPQVVVAGGCCQIPRRVAEVVEPGRPVGILLVGRVQCRHTFGHGVDEVRHAAGQNVTDLQRRAQVAPDIGLAAPVQRRGRQCLASDVDGFVEVCGHSGAQKQDV
jgi:hypothetical protein